MPENFLEIKRYFALTSYCNTIGQSNNAFSILGFSLAGKRRVHFLIFSSIGLWNRWRTLTETIFQGHTKIALSYYKTVEKLWQFNFQRQSLPFHHCHRKQQLRRVARGYFLCRGGPTGRVQGVPPPPWDDLQFFNTTGIMPKKTMWFTGVEVEQETSAPPPKKNSGSPLLWMCRWTVWQKWGCIFNGVSRKGSHVFEIWV